MSSRGQHLLHPGKPQRPGPFPFAWVRAASFVLCLTPALWLAGEWLTQSLGINPLNRLLHATGIWALVMLTLTLAVTPARRLSVCLSQTVHARYGKRLSDWNWLVKLRRQWGLFVFFYASLHLVIYLAFDLGIGLPINLGALRDDVLERPFILLGFAAFVLLVPLAATSNPWAMRRLGRAWKPLHRLSYVVAVLALVHFWTQSKVGDWHALPYTLAIGALLAWRLWDRRSGDEVPVRAAHASVTRAAATQRPSLTPRSTPPPDAPVATRPAPWTTFVHTAPRGRVQTARRRTAGWRRPAP
jgi:methionine sulfoxide reductase heme-binding subunit